MSAGHESKPAWRIVPTKLKASVERGLGSPVARAVRTYGGYAPSATYRLTTADGKKAFFKGTYPLPADSGVRWSLDREERIYRRLGRTIEPWAPRYLGSVRADGWHGLLLEHVDGTPLLPWTRTKVSRAARSYAAFHASTLDRPLPRWLSRTQHRDFSRFWSRIAADEGARARLSALAGEHGGEALEWLRRHLPALRRAERALAAATGAHALLHFDTRSDNVRLQGELLRIFDWPFVSVGPAEFDAAAFAQSIEAEGGPSCEKVVGWYQDVLPLRRDVLIGSAAGIAGYFADRAPRPDMLGLPRLRLIQRLQLRASLGWAARLLDLRPPDWLQRIPV